MNITDTSAILSNSIRLKMIVAAKRLHENGLPYFRPANILTEKNFPNISKRTLEAHLNALVKSGIFANTGRKGCYTYNSLPLQEFIFNINDLFNTTKQND